MDNHRPYLKYAYFGIACFSTTAAAQAENIAEIVGHFQEATASATHSDSGSLSADGNGVEYNFIPLAGHYEVMTKTFEGGKRGKWKLSTEEQSNLAQVPTLRRSASVQGGDATAQVIATIREKPNEFVVNGSIRAQSRAVGGADILVLASASATFELSVSVRRMSTVQVTNCDLFNLAHFEGQRDFSRSGGTCTFKLYSGEMRQNGPNPLGIDIDELKRLMDDLENEEDLPTFDDFDDLEMEDLEGLGSEDLKDLEDYYAIPDQDLGQIVGFEIDATVSSSNRSSGDLENIQGNFSIRIVSGEGCEPTNEALAAARDALFTKIADIHQSNQLTCDELVAYEVLDTETCVGPSESELANARKEYLDDLIEAEKENLPSCRTLELQGKIESCGPTDDELEKAQADYVAGIAEGYFEKYGYPESISCESLAEIPKSSKVESCPISDAELAAARERYAKNISELVEEGRKNPLTCMQLYHRQYLDDCGPSDDELADAHERYIEAGIEQFTKNPPSCEKLKYEGYYGKPCAPSEDVLADARADALVKHQSDASSVATCDYLLDHGYLKSCEVGGEVQMVVCPES